MKEEQVMEGRISPVGSCLIFKVCSGPFNFKSNIFGLSNSSESSRSSTSNAQ